MALTVYRQGDVCFVPIPNLPDIPAGRPQLKKQTGRLIRKGEHGGLHQVSKESVGAEIFTLNGQKYLSAPNGASIVHGEHHEIQLPGGFYEVRIQVEQMNNGFSRYVVD